jgi:hypothetical protein
MTPEIFFQADTSAQLLFLGILGVILVGCMLKLFGPQWDDWLDERVGRGSVRDDWPWSRSRRPNGHLSR